MKTIVRVGKIVFGMVLKLLFLCGLFFMVPIFLVLPLVLPFKLLLSYSIALPLIILSFYVTKNVLTEEIRHKARTLILSSIYALLYLSLIISFTINLFIKDIGIKKTVSNLRSTWGGLQLINAQKIENSDKVPLTRDFLSIKFFEFFPFKPGTYRKLLKFKIRTFDDKEFSFMVDEIFIGQNYFFKTESERPLIVDCGSNIGMAVLYFKYLYPKSRIIAFEPDKRTFEILRENVRLNELKNIILVNKALSDSKGFIRFFIDDTSSLRSSSFRKSGQRWIEVPTSKLSDYIEEDVDFIKIDVEGAEGLIFKDLVQSGKLKFIKQMIVEFHRHIEYQTIGLSEFLKILDDNGFEYQISTTAKLPMERDSVEDILIFAYKK